MGRFLLVVIGIGLIIVIALVGLGVVGPRMNPISPFNNSSIISKQETGSKTTNDLNSETPPLLLKSLGVDLDYYDPKTNKAGDFLFTKKKLQFSRLFMPYGFVIPGNVTSSGKDKANPQPTFILPTGTKVRSLVDGTVANVTKVWSGDYSVQVSFSGKLEEWMYETEHIINPVVKVGEKVKAGQVVGEVSDFDKGAPEGFGTVEIGILKGGNPPQHVCPFAYLDPSIKEQIFQKIKALYQSWEEYTGDTTLYNQESDQVPGCLNLDPIEG